MSTVDSSKDFPKRPLNDPHKPTATSEMHNHVDLDKALQDRPIDEAGNVPNVALKGHNPAPNVKTPKEARAAEKKDPRSAIER
jgi:hypothetical protein